MFFKTSFESGVRNALIALAMFVGPFGEAVQTPGSSRHLSCVLEYLSKSSGFLSGVNVRETTFSISGKGGRSEIISVKGGRATAVAADGYLTLEVKSNSGPSASAVVGLDAPRAKVELKQGVGESEGIHVFLCEEGAAPSANL